MSKRHTLGILWALGALLDDGEPAPDPDEEAALNAALLEYFGDGSDGDVTISSGTTAITRDMVYNNLTINGTGKLSTAGFVVRVKNTLDLRGAPAGAIERIGLAGGNGQAAGTGGTIATNNHSIGMTVAGGFQGFAGAAGGTGAGVQGGASSNPSGCIVQQGGGTSGAGGAGSGGAGGANRTGSVPTTTYGFRLDHLMSSPPIAYAAAGAALTAGLAVCGTYGGPGGGGGGDGTSGAGGGASGNGGGGCWVYAKTILTDNTTASGVMRALAGASGNGGSAAAGNRGGGGGAGGATGGVVYCVYQTYTHTGAPVSNMLDASGAAGGNGGNGTGTGAGGNGGAGGGGGFISVWNLTATTGLQTPGAAGSAGNAASGTTGGTGGAGGVCVASF